jgi:uncharacterized protein YdaU (DUF1376 family)
MMADSESTTGRAPAFQFYPNDFLSDRNVVVMSMQERGVYITLICHAWQAPLPSEPAQLARICGVPFPTFRKLWPALAVCFRESEGVLIHPRLERERQKQQEYRQRQADRGRASGAARRKHHEPSANAGSSPVQTETNRRSVPVEQPAELLSSSSLVLPSGEAPTLSQRAGKFCEWYADKHDEVFHVGYIGNPQKDYQTAIQLAEKFTDAEMQDAALVWFGMDDEWARQGTRTIPRFASRATKCVELARQVPA